MDDARKKCIRFLYTEMFFGTEDDLVKWSIAETINI